MSTQASAFYPNTNSRRDVNFARLEKGLLLFIYIYEGTKDRLRYEVALWDHRLCFYVIKHGRCDPPSGQCHYEHQTAYRQRNLCRFWYMRQLCRFGPGCRNSHNFEQVEQYHNFIRTETDANIYKLIRFVRNFAGHYRDDVIRDTNDQQDLHKNMIIVMVYLVHFLSGKPENSIEHLKLFLEAPTISQLIESNSLQAELRKPYDVPKIFLDLRVNFNAYWYKRNLDTQCVHFNQISRKCAAFFEEIFCRYYKGRLKSRGAKAPWYG